MIFVLDIGNTNTVLGVFEQDNLKYHWRIETNRNKTEDEYGMLVKALLQDEGLSFVDITGVIISSVVPPIMRAFETMCRKYIKKKPLIVGPGIKTGLDIKYENPREVGADRIVNAVAAVHEYGSPLIVVDFGTATTYCYINKIGQYMGGAISPGISISTEALYTKASKLPRIELSFPSEVIGKNTIHAMQSGILYGYIGQVEGLVERIKRTTNVDAKVIATGGFATLISEQSTIIDTVDSFLTLKGLYLLYKRNI